MIWLKKMSQKFLCCLLHDHFPRQDCLTRLQPSCNLMSWWSFGPSKITRKKSITAYSPTTGTYQMSPFSSPTTPKEQEHRNGPSNGTRKLNSFSSPAGKESIAKDSDEFTTLLSTIERSSEKTVEIMKNLSSIQALEGNRQLEDLIGISLVPCVLKGEAKKTKELMTKVTKQKLLKKKNSRIPPKEHHLDSFAFLKAILN
ncbi:centromere protein R isoform X2 [Meriones unguiculatus]|uniref:centromere protein R isoform X2 n=1 Tax=Meriones unguiculatus TaxID=10047 RepID=UPI00293E0ACA|nr:centromere protein R isoform X2 [Meriones unguiculatus]XP_060221942.1 centromere protein R isoform X2 [Meriones unguiculatus]XP_060221943.1 centromere protein R isoform X2 [Meriones unguiculatus]